MQNAAGMNLEVRKNSSPFVNHRFRYPKRDFVPSLKLKRWKVRPGRIISWAVQTSKLMLVPRGRYMTEHPRHLRKKPRARLERGPSEGGIERESFSALGAQTRDRLACTVIGNFDEVLLKYLLIVPSLCTWEPKPRQRLETFPRDSRLSLHFASAGFREWNAPIVGANKKKRKECCSSDLTIYYYIIRETVFWNFYLLTSQISSPFLA